MDNTKIDMVYLWVDGSDKNWLKKKATWLNKGEDIDTEACADCRFIDNDELKYSLRSLEKCIPWINNIYIVTDAQTPKWLNTDNPKIKIVDHRDIMPGEALPCFNSMALEACLVNIEGLSEHFLYANDDMFFSGEVKPNFFFNGDGYPIFRFGAKVHKHKNTSLYMRCILNSREMIQNKFKRCFCHRPHHNVDAYRKSDIIECNKIFAKEMQNTILSHTRDASNISRIIYSYYGLATNRGEFRKTYLNLWEKLWNCLHQTYGRESVLLNARNIEKMNKKLKMYRPSLFCINDSENTKQSDRENACIFLEKLFPIKSQFEK